MNYNLIAPFYDLLSRIAFLNQQQKAHELILKYIKPDQRILWIGGGSGWFLKSLDSLQMNLIIDYVENSEVMIRKAKSVEVKNLEIHFIQEDAFQYAYIKSYDIIITAFFFDHFEEEQCQPLILQLDQTLNKKGLWFFVDFVQQQNYWQKMITQSMIYFFRVVAQIKTKKFPPLNNAFENYEVVEEKHYFLQYIVARIYRK